MNTLFLDALLCKKTERPPVWMMRQAGRYLPQYRKLRERHGLSDLFHNAELAAEVTLMPFDLLNLDAAIVFSDILLIAEIFGKRVHYPESGGPRIEPSLCREVELQKPSFDEVQEKFSYISKTISLLKPQLSVPLLGFCGAPFTLLCYLLEGSGKSSFPQALEWIRAHREKIPGILEVLSETCIQYLRMQIEAGVDAIQVFDSWANLLSEDLFKQYSLPYWKKILEALPSVPVIFFSRNTSIYPEEIAALNPSGISFDEGRPLLELRRAVPSHIAVQGNLSPIFLAEASMDKVRQATLELLESVKGQKGVILNLGHGVLPHTPIQNAQCFVETIKQDSFVC